MLSRCEDGSALINYINAEQYPSVVLFRNFNGVNSKPMIWIILTDKKTGSKISGIDWCKTRLKKLINTYARSLEIDDKKLIWKISINSNDSKMNILWNILFKVYKEITYHGLKEWQSDTVFWYINQEIVDNDPCEDYNKFVIKYNKKLNKKKSPNRRLNLDIKHKREYSDQIDRINIHSASIEYYI